MLLYPTGVRESCDDLVGFVAEGCVQGNVLKSARAERVDPGPKPVGLGRIVGQDDRKWTKRVIVFQPGRISIRAVEEHDAMVLDAPTKKRLRIWIPGEG